MACAANFAWVNRSSMTFLTRQAFAKVAKINVLVLTLNINAIATLCALQMFHSDPDDLDMQVIYDVSHNIAKVEEHMVNGKPKTLLVHRKGSTRAFPPHHPLISVDYQVLYCCANTVHNNH